MLLVSLAVTLIMPRLLQRSTDNVLAKPLLAPVIGIAVHVVVPIALILLAMTVVGIPLAILLGLVWIVILMLSGPFFAYLLGRLIIRDSRRPMMIMLVGATVLLLLYFVPLLGVIALLGAFWYGTGMLALEIAERFPRPAAAPARSESTAVKSNTSRKK
jgi:Kef-type K+ transport system membrane component KefB